MEAQHSQGPKEVTLLFTAEKEHPIYMPLLLGVCMGIKEVVISAVSIFFVVVVLPPGSFKIPGIKKCT